MHTLLNLPPPLAPNNPQRNYHHPPVNRNTPPNMTIKNLTSVIPAMVGGKNALARVMLDAPPPIERKGVTATDDDGDIIFDGSTGTCQAASPTPREAVIIFDALVLLNRHASMFSSARTSAPAADSTTPSRGSTMGVITADNLFISMFARESVRILARIPTANKVTFCFYTDHYRNKRAYLALKDDESHRRRENRERSEKARNVAPARAYPRHTQVVDGGVIEDPETGEVRPIEVSRLIASQGTPAGDAWWEYAQARLANIGVHTSLHRFLRAAGLTNYLPTERVGEFRFEADLPERQGSLVIEADIEIIRRALRVPNKNASSNGAGAKPQIPVQTHIVTVDSDAVVHAVYAFWDDSPDVAHSRDVFIHRARGGPTPGGPNLQTDKIIDVASMISCIKATGITREHFLAASIMNGCDFFQAADGVCITNIGPVPFWESQKRIASIMKDADFTSYAGIVALYKHTITAHVHGDFDMTIPLSGDIDVVSGCVEPDRVQAEFTKYYERRRAAKCRSYRCPVPPMRHMAYVCVRFKRVWDYWVDSLVPYPTHLVGTPPIEPGLEHAAAFATISCERGAAAAAAAALGV